jgi:hypothetical protein
VWEHTHRAQNSGHPSRYATDASAVRDAHLDDEERQVARVGRAHLAHVLGLDDRPELGRGDDHGRDHARPPRVLGARVGLGRRLCAQRVRRLHEVARPGGGAAGR